MAFVVVVVPYNTIHTIALAIYLDVSFYIYCCLLETKNKNKNTCVYSNKAIPAQMGSEGEEKSKKEKEGKSFVTSTVQKIKTFIQITKRHHFPPSISSLFLYILLLLPPEEPVDKHIIASIPFLTTQP